MKKEKKHIVANKQKIGNYTRRGKTEGDMKEEKQGGKTCRSRRGPKLEKQKESKGYSI